MSQRELFYNDSMLPFLCLDNHLKIIDCNKRFTQETQLDSQYIIGKSLEEIFPDSKVSGRIAIYKKTIKTGQTITTEQLIKTPTGKKYYQIIVFKLSHGIGITAINNNDVNIQLRKTNFLLNSIINDSLELIQKTSIDGRILYVNKTWKSILGYSTDEVKNLSILNIIDDESLDHCMQVFKKITVEGEFVNNINIIFKKKNGEKLYAKGYAKPIIEGGKIWGSHSFFITNSEEEKRKKQINEKEGIIKSIFDQSNDAMIILNENGKIIQFNNAASDLIGLTNKSKGANIETLWPEKKMEFDYLVRKLICQKKVHEKIVFTDSKGNKIKTSASASKFKISSNEDLIYLVIHNRSREEFLIEEKENIKFFYQEILDHLPADIAVFDKNHNYLYVNPNGMKTKKLREWIIGKNDFDYCKYRNIDDSLARKRRSFFLEMKEKKESIEWVDEHIDKTNTKHYILRKLHPVIKNESVDFVVGYAVDISNSMRLREELINSKEINSKLVELSDVIFYIQDIYNQNSLFNPFCYISKNIKTYFGVDDKSMIENQDYFINALHPDDKDEFIQNYLHTINSGEPKSIIYRIKNKITNEYIWINDYLMPTIDSVTKKVNKLYGTIKNITNLKENEINLINQKKAIEQMLYITSHKVRQPVTNLLGVVNLLEDSDKNKDNLELLLGHIKESAIKLDAFTKELTDFMNKTNNNDFKII